MIDQLAEGLSNAQPSTQASPLDLDALVTQIEKIASEVAKFEKKLANESFLAKAPEAVVAEQRERKADAEAQQAKVAEALKRLEAA